MQTRRRRALQENDSQVPLSAPKHQLVVEGDDQSIEKKLGFENEATPIKTSKRGRKPKKQQNVESIGEASSSSQTMEDESHSQQHVDQVIEKQEFIYLQNCSNAVLNRMNLAFQNIHDFAKIKNSQSDVHLLQTMIPYLQNHLLLQLSQSDLRSNIVAARKIQRKIRALQFRREILTQVSKLNNFIKKFKERAAVKIQSYFRFYLARKRMYKKLCITQLQCFAKTVLYDFEDLQMRNISLIKQLQSLTRDACNAISSKNYFHHLQTSSLILSSKSLAKLERRSFVRSIGGIKLISKWWNKNVRLFKRKTAVGIIKQLFLAEKHVLQQRKLEIGTQIAVQYSVQREFLLQISKIVHLQSLYRVFLPVEMINFVRNNTLNCQQIVRAIPSNDTWVLYREKQNRIEQKQSQLNSFSSTLFSIVDYAKNLISNLTPKKRRLSVVEDQFEKSLVERKKLKKTHEQIEQDLNQIPIKNGNATLLEELERKQTALERLKEENRMLRELQKNRVQALLPKFEDEDTATFNAEEEEDDDSDVINQRRNRKKIFSPSKAFPLPKAPETPKKQIQPLQKEETISSPFSFFSPIAATPSRASVFEHRTILPHITESFESSKKSLRKTPKPKHKGIPAKNKQIVQQFDLSYTNNESDSQSKKRSREEFEESSSILETLNWKDKSVVKYSQRKMPRVVNWRDNYSKEMEQTPLKEFNTPTTQRITLIDEEEDHAVPLFQYFQEKSNTTSPLITATVMGEDASPKEKGTPTKMPKSKSNKYYAVKVGRNPGVYGTWDECKAQVDGYPKAVFKSFGTESQAWDFVNGTIPSHTYPVQQSNTTTTSQQQQQQQQHYSHSPMRVQQQPFVNTTTNSSIVRDIASIIAQNLRTTSSSSSSRTTSSISIPFSPSVTNVNLDTRVAEDASKTILAYTDGSCFNNGSKSKVVVGGIGVYFANGEVEHISEPYIADKVTNQRCELAAIKACLESVSKLNKHLIIFSDSQYSIKCLQNWMFGWEKKGWITSQGTPVENMDLLEEIIDLIANRFDQFSKGIQLIHVRGHQNNVGNNMADRLAVAGSQQSLLQG